MIREGGCHCGAVRFAVAVPGAVTLSTCACRICSMTGFLHFIVPAGEFTLLHGAAALTDYRFNTGTARHLFCATCGIKSFYVPRSHPDGYSVDWRTLDETDGVAVTVTAFDPADWPAIPGSD